MPAKTKFIKKPNNNQPQKKPIAIFWKIFVMVLLVLLLWGGYSIAAHYSMLAQEERDFKQLKADMLAFQADFNKIDPGWEYSEGCNRNGEVFKKGEASNCGVTLVTKQDRHAERYLELLSKSKKAIFSLGGSKTFRDSAGLYIDYDLKYLPNDKMSCGLRTEKSKSEKLLMKRLGCTGNAHKFYFAPIY